MRKKMCKWWRTPKENVCHKEGNPNQFGCPDAMGKYVRKVGTCEFYCNPIPPKKVVIVKSWAYVGEHFCETKGIHAVPENYEGTVPCKIVISAANYKKIRGAK